MKKYILGLFLVGFLLAPGLSFAQVGDVDPNSNTDQCVTIVNNLRYRDRDIYKNGEVSTLQDFLQSKGYLNSEPTGYFGLLTFKAVKDFQNANYITPASGYVGPITRAKIKNLTCGGIIPQPNEQRFTGYLSVQGPNVMMWGTHTLAVSSDVNCITAAPCSGNAMAKSYLVGANNSSVLSDLNRYENSRVTIWGQLKWYDLEGGFWGINASKVIPLSENSSNPVISGVSGPQSLNVNQTGTWTVNAYDPNGGNLSYYVNWGDVMVYGNGASTVSPQYLIQQSATFTHSYSYARTFNPTFTVSSDNGIRCITTPCNSGGSASTSLSVNVGNLIYLPGCTSYQGYSSTTGQACSGGTTTIACSSEARMCPDGSYVGRSGPNCEFVCPTNILGCTSTQGYSVTTGLSCGI